MLQITSHNSASASTKMISSDGFYFMLPLCHYKLSSLYNPTSNKKQATEPSECLSKNISHKIILKGREKKILINHFFLLFYSFSIQISLLFDCCIWSGRESSIHPCSTLDLIFRLPSSLLPFSSSFK